MDLGNFIAGIFYSLLPRRWWRGWSYASTADFARSAVLSGLLEMLFFATLTLGQFERHMASRSKLIANANVNEGTQLWLLGIFIFDFLIQPVSMVVVYFTLEGFARGYTAWLHGAVLPTLPLYLLSKWGARHDRRRTIKSMGPWMQDMVEQVSDHEVRIFSSRPKDWTPATTIAFRQQMWELEKAEELSNPRRYAYRLKLRTSTVAIRVLREYDPETEPLPRD